MNILYHFLRKKQAENLQQLRGAAKYCETKNVRFSPLTPIKQEILDESK